MEESVSSIACLGYTAVPRPKTGLPGDPSSAMTMLAVTSSTGPSQDQIDLVAVVRAAEAVRAESSQENSKFAAVLFDRRKGTILMPSANSFAPGVSLTLQEMRADREKKDDYISHAEFRALSRYTRAVLEGRMAGTDPAGLGLYTTNAPCPACAKAISEMGVGWIGIDARSVDPGRDRYARNWAIKIMRGLDILTAGGVAIDFIEVSREGETLTATILRPPHGPLLKAVSNRAAQIERDGLAYEAPSSAQSCGPACGQPTG